MTDSNHSFFHGRGMDGLKDIAENGVIKGFQVDDHEVFPGMSPEMNVYGKENAVWVTDQRSCAEIYGWGGGYLEINPSDLKIVEDRNSCYAVIMQEEVSLDQVDRILVEQKEGPRSEPQRDFDIEIANLLDEQYKDMPIATYKPTQYIIDE